MQDSAIDNTQWQQHGDDATDTTDDEERRPAEDGNYYTQNEFLMFYNGDPTMWELLFCPDALFILPVISNDVP